MNKVVIFLFILTVLFAPAAFAACPDLAGHFHQALKVEDIGRADVVFREMRDSFSCEAEERKIAKYALSDAKALRLEGDLYQMQVNGVDRLVALAQNRSDLEQSLHPAKGWRALVLNGELAHYEGSHGKAARMFCRASDILNNKLLVPKLPKAERLAEIKRLAQQSDLLAKAGEDCNFVSRNISRAFKINSVIPPITFKYNSVHLTQKGIRAVSKIKSWLDDKPEVSIHGHTDPQGSDSFNDDLSYRRAERIAKLLTEQGYRGIIKSYGHGERKPLRIENRSYFSQQDLCQMQRRVEIQIGGQVQNPLNYDEKQSYKNLSCS